MNIAINRVRKGEERLIKELFEKAGDKFFKVNEEFFYSDKNILLVADNGTTTCGFLYAYILEKLNDEKADMYLHSIDVFQEFKKKGIGMALIEELKNVAASNGCSEIFLITNNSNTAAMRLYEKSGGIRENNDDVMFDFLL
ncbi:GNAT family N-acetyltransferase [Oceanirhabdus seepicola]|uniref:GNAT family N-acetyltransferase n=1 Tax=Oceanirhabdus seepicola TaxID=2828781 RepID=A0A9J6NY23_9CLOT|nr:GNAT family N-acetyltransferase [Oceanirhabdus seepicola]MCM1988886.1 GNAT family N-acetyltransferase [Oceanirhabdus seepicola]